MWASLIAFDFLAYARGAACVPRQLVGFKHASLEYEYHHSETGHAPCGGDVFEQQTPRDPLLIDCVGNLTVNYVLRLRAEAPESPLYITPGTLCSSGRALDAEIERSAYLLICLRHQPSIKWTNGWMRREQSILQ